MVGKNTAMTRGDADRIVAAIAEVVHELRITNQHLSALRQEQAPAQSQPPPPPLPPQPRSW